MEEVARHWEPLVWPGQSPGRWNKALAQVTVSAWPLGGAPRLSTWSKKRGILPWALVLTCRGSYHLWASVCSPVNQGTMSRSNLTTKRKSSFFKISLLATTQDETTEMLIGFREFRECGGDNAIHPAALGSSGKPQGGNPDSSICGSLTPGGGKECSQRKHL